MEIITAFVITILFHTVDGGTPVTCFSCGLLQYPYECKYIKQCELGERCYIERVETQDNGFGWIQGCTDKCTPVANSSLNLSFNGGRNDVMTSSVANKDFYQTKCRHCCDTDFCNIAACEAPELPNNDTRLHCYNCRDSPHGCDTIKLCAQDELCGFERGRTILYQHNTYHTYTASCKSVQDCDSAVRLGFPCELTCCDTPFCNHKCNLTRNKQTYIGAICARMDNYTYDRRTDTCVRTEHHQLNFEQSVHACAQEGADLVLLNSQRKFEYIKSLLSATNDTADFWIGAEKRPNVTYFRWSDGNPVDVHSTNWLRIPPLKQPDNPFTLNEHCVYMDFRDRYLWHDASCDIKLDGYICEITTKPKQQKVLQCRGLLYDGFFHDLESDTCLKVVPRQHVTWSEALKECEKYPNGTLLSLDVFDKIDIVYTMFFIQQINDTNYWIGGKSSEQHPDQFVWTSGLDYSDMSNFTPLWGHADIRSHMGMILDHRNNFLWSYRHVNEKYSFICEITEKSIQNYQTTHAMTSPTPTLPVSTVPVKSSTLLELSPTKVQHVITASTKHVVFTPAPMESTTPIKVTSSNHSTSPKHVPTVTDVSTTQTVTISTNPSSSTKRRFTPAPTKETTLPKASPTSTSFHASPNIFTFPPISVTTHINTSSNPVNQTQSTQVKETIDPVMETTQFKAFFSSTSPNTELISTTVPSWKTTDTKVNLSTDHNVSTAVTIKSHPNSTNSPTATTTNARTTEKKPQTIPPVSTTCHVCSGPEFLCELLHKPVSCAPPKNYCLNTVVNHRDGTRSVNRRCGDAEECYREWWLGSSDSDKCRHYDQDFFMTMDFQCTFCCVKDNCNERIRPPSDTFYKPV